MYPIRAPACRESRSYRCRYGRGWGPGASRGGKTEDLREVIESARAMVSEQFQIAEVDIAPTKAANLAAKPGVQRHRPHHLILGRRASRSAFASVGQFPAGPSAPRDRKSTRLNSSH